MHYFLVEFGVREDNYYPPMLLVDSPYITRHTCITFCALFGECDNFYPNVWNLSYSLEL